MIIARDMCDCSSSENEDRFCCSFYYGSETEVVQSKIMLQSSYTSTMLGLTEIASHAHSLFNFCHCLHIVMHLRMAKQMLIIVKEADQRGKPLDNYERKLAHKETQTEGMQQKGMCLPSSKKKLMKIFFHAVAIIALAIE